MNTPIMLGVWTGPHDREHVIYGTTHISGRDWDPEEVKRFFFRKNNHFSSNLIRFGPYTTQTNPGWLAGWLGLQRRGIILDTTPTIIWIIS